MKKATRSILEELNNLNFNRNKTHLIETTGVNLVRFINSIKSADPRKFKRGVQKINESRKNDS